MFGAIENFHDRLKQELARYGVTLLSVGGGFLDECPWLGEAQFENQPCLYLTATGPDGREIEVGFGLDSPQALRWTDADAERLLELVAKELQKTKAADK
jgi:hypothetical protein